MPIPLQGCGISRKAGTLEWLRGLVEIVLQADDCDRSGQDVFSRPVARMCRSALGSTDDSGAY
jgi:hypothetical protein